MNAYELADDLEQAANLEMELGRPENWADLKTAADMLRQLATEKAELEKQGEPVAWMQIHYKDNIPTKFSPVKVWEDDIPLYTTPQTKPLTDEEIKQIWYNLYPLSSSSYWDDKREGLAELKFAKAILRKAQEK